MIDDGVLVQVYSTVLVGVLIFLTLERRFEGEEVGDKAKNLEKEIKHQQRVLDFHKVDRENVIRDKECKRDSDIVRPEYFDNRIKTIDMESQQDTEKMNTLQSELDKMKEKHSQEIEEYNDKTTQENIITMTMIVFLVSSIISLLIGYVFAARMPPEILTPVTRIISFGLFSIAMILLVGRVYLHNK